MMPIGPLMIEHRLIERMIKIMAEELHRIDRIKKINTGFIEIAVDFIRTYADRCHHGKEEDILFRDLKEKNLSHEHRQIMAELEEDHRRGREITAQLLEINERYKKGDEKTVNALADSLQSLIDFYPKHIEKEDRHFFIPVMAYFDAPEKAAMLNEEYEFDRTLIHEKYKNIVTQFE